MTVTDDWGRRVTLTARPGRIVSLAPHATESLVAAGALERLVAVDPSSDHPPAVRSLPRVAAYPAPDLEALAALRPDLVIVWGAGARASAIERIEALGIRVFVSDPRRSADVSSTLKRLAQFSPSPAIALEAAREFDSTMARLRDRYRDAPAVPVFVQIGSHPLMTLNDRDSIGDALRICGGRNVFAGVGTVAATVGPEAVLAAAPSLIVSTEAAGSREPWQSLGVLEPRGGLRIGWIGPAIHRPGPRFAALVEQLCGLIDEARSERPGHVSARSLR
ncbi:MAG TPA: helical backbone metal receptor [Burkholderiaceae bacterium]|nr:helical backbone metal receptor [Burkholderiaceae bacterium]